MHSNAQNMNSDRIKRIAELEVQEKVMSEVEHTERMTNAKYGGQARFLTGASKKAGELDLGERVRRGCQEWERVGISNKSISAGWISQWPWGVFFGRI